MVAEEQLLRHLETVTGLERPLLRKILSEIHAWYGADLAGWLRRRHAELQRQGMRNREIYPRLQQELRATLVRPTELSERQIRRLLYG